jgi:hypothetical protein
MARLPSEPLLIGALMLVLSGALQWSFAQGIERESLAGEGAETAAVEANANQPYNLSLGPVNVRADASLSTAYNDNIGVAHTGRIGDCIITPTLGLHALWQATDLNALSLDVSLGYQWYTFHSSNSSLYINPNSAAQFNIYAGDFKINLHDRFSYSQDPINIGQLSNVNQFPLLENVAGFDVDWDLSDLIVSLGYDHQNQWVFDSAYSYLTYQSDTVTPKVTFHLSKTLDVGLVTALSSMRYNQDVQNNNTSITAGPFVTAQLSENISADAGLGADFANYDRGGSNGDTTNLGSFYANAGISQRVNNVISQSFTAGREFIPGVSSNYTQRIYTNYNLSWQATNFLTVGPSLWWENLHDSEAEISENANRYGAGLNLAYSLTDHSNLGLNYQYVLKNASPSIDSYEQDVVTLDFLYHF